MKGSKTSTTRDARANSGKIGCWGISCCSLSSTPLSLADSFWACLGNQIIFFFIGMEIKSSLTSQEKPKSFVNQFCPDSYICSNFDPESHHFERVLILICIKGTDPSIWVIGYVRFGPTINHWQSYLPFLFYKKRRSATVFWLPDIPRSRLFILRPASPKYYSFFLNQRIPYRQTYSTSKDAVSGIRSDPLGVHVTINIQYLADIKPRLQELPEFIILLQITQNQM